MKDRLEQLRAAHGDEAEFVDISLSMEEGDNFMDHFFKECENLREALDDVESDVANVDKKHSLILSNPVNDDKTKEELDQLMLEIKKKNKKIQLRLQAIEKSIVKDENKGVVSADLRIRKSQHSTLSRRFVEIMTEYNRVQTDYRDRCKKRIGRQLEIAGKSVDDEQLEDMIESGNPQIFTQDIITEAEDMKKTLADIEARHSDIMKLEKSIIELHDMFMDMAMLVESQGEVIDRIEYNVVNAQDYVDKAVADTKKAQAFQSKARRKKIIILIMLSVITCVIILIIIFMVK